MFYQMFQKNTNKIVLFFGLWLAIFLVAILLRLPHFFSDGFFFDCDEAIIGIMAKDFLQGKVFPMYFYGQNYGFSTFETIVAALFIPFSSPIWALKLAGLCLYSLGCTFLVLILRIKNISWIWCLVISLILILFPSWFLWASRLRGGYLTAFVGGAFLWFVFEYMKNWTLLKMMFLGGLLGVVFESQVLILLMTLPVIVFAARKNQRFTFQQLLIIVIFSFFTVFAIKYFGHNESVFWEKPELVFDFATQFNTLKSQLTYLLFSFTNFYSFTALHSIPLFWKIGASLVSVLILIIGYLRMRRVRDEAFFWTILIVALLISLFLISSVVSSAPRYWIGVYTGLLFFLVDSFIVMYRNHIIRILYVCLVLLFCVGVVSSLKMRYTWYESTVNEIEAFDALYQEVNINSAKGVYFTDEPLQWQWNYLYGEKIPATSYYPISRTTTYSKQVKEIYDKEPTSVVLCGLWGIFWGMDTLSGFNDTRYQVGKNYYYQPNASSLYVEYAKKQTQ
jgi:hypothetical protein